MGLSKKSYNRLSGTRAAKRRLAAAAVTATLSIALSGSQSRATAHTWKGTTSSAWELSGNWSPSTGYPNATATTDTVAFGNGATPTLVLGNAETISFLKASLSASSYTLSGQTLVLDAGYSGANSSKGLLSALNPTATTLEFDNNVVFQNTGGGTVSQFSARAVRHVECEPRYADICRQSHVQ